MRFPAILALLVLLAGCGENRKPTVVWTCSGIPTCNPVSWSDIPVGHLLVTVARITSPTSSEQHQILIDARNSEWIGEIDTRRDFIIAGRPKRAGGLLARFHLEVADEKRCSVRHELEYSAVQWEEFTNGKQGDERQVTVQPNFSTSSFNGAVTISWGQWAYMGGVCSSSETRNADGTTKGVETRNETWFLRVDHGPLKR